MEHRYSIQWQTRVMPAPSFWYYTVGHCKEAIADFKALSRGTKAILYYYEDKTGERMPLLSREE